MIDHVELVRVESPDGVHVMFYYDCGATDRFEFYDQSSIDFVMREALLQTPPDVLLIALRNRANITVH